MTAKKHVKKSSTKPAEIERFITVADTVHGLLGAYPKYRSDNLKALVANDLNVITEWERRQENLLEGLQVAYVEARRLGLPTDPAPLTRALLGEKGGDGDTETIEAAQDTLLCLILDARAVQAATGKSETPAKPTGKRLAEPSKIAFAAYRLCLIIGTQQEIAQMLEKEYRRPVSQSDVSRGIKKVKEWLEAGNILPDLDQPGKRKGKTYPTDPKTLERNTEA